MTQTLLWHEIEQLPYHRFLGVRIVNVANDSSELAITVNEASANIEGHLHGGVIYSLCDLAGYLALSAELTPDILAVTHDIQVSVMRPAKIGDRVSFMGEITRRGRSLAFLRASAYVNHKLVASANLTKSLLDRSERAACNP